MRGSSPVLITAALSVAALLAAAGAQFGSLHAPIVHAARSVEIPAYLPTNDSNGNGEPDWQEELKASGIDLAPAAVTEATDTDPLSNIAAHVAQQLFGGYLSLKQSGSYTAASGEALGANVAAQLSATPHITPVRMSDLTVNTDATEAGMLRYRGAMREALQPLVNSDDPEITLVGKYVASKDPYWLTQLTAASERYMLAAKNMQAVHVPKDALEIHLRALNALRDYGDTTARIAKYGSDSLALFALLKTLDQNEAEMVASFDALARYYVNHIAHN